MAAIAPAVKKITPSFEEPGLALAYQLPSSAPMLLADSEIRIRLSPEDLFVYLNSLTVRSNVQGGQNPSRLLPGVDLISQLHGFQTYFFNARETIDRHAVAAANFRGYSLPQAIDLGMDQGFFRMACNMILFGVNPGLGEGLLNVQGAYYQNLVADSFGNTTIRTYDNGQLAIQFLTLISQVLQATNQTTLPTRVAILMPQTWHNQLFMNDVVQLTQYQRPGAGTDTTGEMIKRLGEGNNVTVEFGIDDALKGAGSSGSDACVITIPELKKPTTEYLNTNKFADLQPSINAVNLMYGDMAKPIKIESPGPSGSFVVDREWRLSPGIGFRPEGTVILNAVY